MSLDSLISDLLAEQLASEKIVAKIASDTKILEKNNAVFDKIVALLSFKDNNVTKHKFLHLTIGGSIVTLNCSIIEHYVEENYLFALLSDKYSQLLVKDKNDRVFLDLDVRWVKPQLNWLRDMALWNGEEKLRPKMSGVQPLLIREYEIISRHFQSELHVASSTDQTATNWLSAHSSILRGYPASDEAIQLMLPSAEDCVLRAKLLYRSSRDGYSATSFHKHCDGRKNTLCIIRDTDDSIFGAFTGDVAWKVGVLLNCFDYVSAPNAFLFLLTKSNVLKPVKCKAKPGCFLRCSSVSTPASLFGFGDKYVSCSDLAVHADRKSFSWAGLGNAFECKDKSDFTEGKVSELEVFEVIFDMETRDLHSPIPTVTVPFVSSMKCNLPLGYSQLMQHRLDMNMKIQEKVLAIEGEMQQLFDKAVSMLKELKFVAKFVGVTLPATVHKDEENSVSDMSELEKTLNEIQTFVKLLTADRAETSSTVNDVITSDVSSIVYINAGGRKIATTKSTLLQAPSGSILANMASDVWGHDLDSGGNIFQDVNPDLFTAVINHLRLKALLSASDVPPIAVYESQRTAMDNLLSFYMIEDVKVEYINEQTFKRVKLN